MCCLTPVTIICAAMFAGGLLALGLALREPDERPARSVRWGGVRLIRWLPALLVVGVLALFGLSLLRGPLVASSPLVGKPAPGFTLATLEGGRVGLETLRGKPVVLNFWASWCVPCRTEMPLLERAWRAHAGEGLAVVGVVYADSNENARGFYKELDLTFPSLIDASGKTAVDYGVTGLPETYFIDRSGVIVAKKYGALEADELEARIAEIR